VASVWISGDDHQAAFAIVCLRFVITLDCYCSLFHWPCRQGCSGG